MRTPRSQNEFQEAKRGEHGSKWSEGGAHSTTLKFTAESGKFNLIKTELTRKIRYQDQQKSEIFFAAPLRGRVSRQCRAVPFILW